MKLRHLFIIAVLMLGCVSSIYAKDTNQPKSICLALQLHSMTPQFI